jgi:hypothetical protein
VYLRYCNIEMYAQNEVDETHWSEAERKQVRRLETRQELFESKPSLWREPFIVPEHVLNSRDFVLSSFDNDIKGYLLDQLGDCAVTVGEECCPVLLRDWFRDFRLKPEMYLRDMHVNRVKNGFRLFTTPSEFPDWLNQYCTEIVHAIDRPVLDFQFLYWGAAGSKTPFHRDVMGTFSWSHNLCGMKRWNFFLDTTVILECTQGPGETVFVPSQCFHTVVNLSDDTISINQNWLNQFNIHKVAEQLVADTVKAREDLVEYGMEESQELVEQVEAIVWANNSLNLENLLKVIDFATDIRGGRSIVHEGRRNILLALDTIHDVYRHDTLTTRIRRRLA